jgi:hypothetical protein
MMSSISRRRAAMIREQADENIASPYTPAPWILPTLITAALLSFVLLVAVTIGRSVVRFGYAALKLLGRTATKSGPAVIYAATIAGIVASVFVSLVDLRQVQELEPDRLVAEQGYAYRATIPKTDGPIPVLVPLRAGRDTSSAPMVRLLEDGKEVGLPRARSALVQSLGAGRYNVRESSLQFSTPDNSDPRTNGRTYAVQERLGLPDWFGIAVIVLVAASLVLLARKRQRLVLAGVSAAAAVGGIVGVLSHFDLITHDQYISPANAYQVANRTIGFAISGNIGPFVSIAPLGSPTAIGVGDQIIECHRKPQVLDALAQDGNGACAPRGSSVEVDAVLPDSAGERAAPDFYRYPVRLHLYAIIGLFAVAVVALLAMWLRPTRAQAMFGLGAVFGGIGILLIGANVLGFFLPLRAEMPTEPVPGIRIDAERLPFDDGIKQLAWRDSDSAESYARRANQVIFESMIHGDPSTDLGRWRLEIPVWENWSLNALGAVNPTFKKYRYWDHVKEFERGVGLCGNLSAILVGYLAEQGIAGRIVGLHGHVVVTAEVRPGVWYIFDPDYGVVLPYSVEELQNSPNLVEGAYRSATDPRTLGMIVDYYATSENNSVDQSGRDGFYSSWDGSAEIYRNREQFMEWLKWVAPSLMLAAGLALGVGAYLLRRRRRDPSGQAEAPATEPAAAAGPA